MQQQPPRREYPTGGIRMSPKKIVVLVLAVLAVIFALQNSQSVDLSIFFWDITLGLVWALLIFGLIGALVGWMVAHMRANRRG